MKVKFDSFNQFRNMRGAAAAKFVITTEHGDEYAWMSKNDIEENIKKFPEYSEELNKGLHCYSN